MVPSARQARRSEVRHRRHRSAQRPKRPGSRRRHLDVQHLPGADFPRRSECTSFPAAETFPPADVEWRNGVYPCGFRDLLFITTIVALAIGWWFSSVRYAAIVATLKDELATETRLNAAKLPRLENQLKLLEIQLHVQESPLQSEKKVVVE